MPDCMTEVKQGSPAVLTLVVFDHIRLMPQRSRNDGFKRLGPARDNRRHFALEIVNHPRLQDGGVLDHLSEALAEFALGQRCQGADVRYDQSRLVEGSN